MKQIIALAFLNAALAHAGNIDITVNDKDGKPVPGVVVLVEAVTVAASAPHSAAKAKPVVIAQEGSQFVPATSVVQVGSTLRFVNKDSYDHHVRSTPTGPLGSVAPVKNFELRLDGRPSGGGQTDLYPTAPARTPSGTSTGDVKVDQAGAIGLGCHIHGSMRGHVYVSATPWFGKTDANGNVSIANVPDGNAKLVFWHPDQLAEQTPVTAQATAAPLKVVAQLNFSPKRRRL